MTLRNLLIAIVLLGAGLAQAQNDERIIDFHSDITVQQDGSMLVRETIRVNVLGQRIKRGIYRDFPTTYRDTHGKKIVVAFDVQQVLRGGKPEAYHTESLRNGVRVYFGRADYLLPRGKYTYTIAYRTSHQLGFFDEHDELYWNVTGNGWDFAIDSASATVTLPEGISEPLELHAYTGLQGARGTDSNAEVDDSGRATFASTRRLVSREGLTIVVEFPKGFVDEPTASERAAFFLGRTAGNFVIAGGVLILLLYYVLVWARVGKDPVKGQILPREAPPEGFSPEALRYIRRMGIDKKVFSVALVNMAVKGYLRIDQRGETGSKDFLIVRDHADDDVLTDEERVIARSLLGSRESIELDNSNHLVIAATLSKFLKALTGTYKNTYFLRNGLYLIPGVLFSVACFIAAAMLSGSSILLLVAGSIAFLAMHITFGILLKAPTREGRRLLDEVEGFIMYLKGDGMNRLSTESGPEALRQRFEEYLPYAIAFDVGEPWADDFTSALRATSPDIDQEDEYQPTWYHGSNWHTVGILGMTSSLSDGFAGVVASSATAPGSSSGGGGGGGFSGGGGGGGGGGGW